jgi:hypothetical protein
MSHFNHRSEFAISSRGEGRLKSYTRPPKCLNRTTRTAHEEAFSNRINQLNAFDDIRHIRELSEVENESDNEADVNEFDWNIIAANSSVRTSAFQQGFSPNHQWATPRRQRPIVKSNG